MRWLTANWSIVLSIGANVAQITTGIVAGTVGLRYLWFARKRRLMLENYLRNMAPQSAVSRLNELIALSGMTEGQIFEAALASERIHMRPSIDPSGGPGELLFHYVDKKRSKLRRKKAE
jgi:hypothetical protein